MVGKKLIQRLSSIVLLFIHLSVCAQSVLYFKDSYKMNVINSGRFKEGGGNTPTLGLVAEWKCSGNANDTSGNGNNGTVYGATLTADRDSVANSAYYFDGGDRIDITEVSDFDAVFNSDFTFCFWIRIDETSRFLRRIFAFFDSTTDGIDLYCENNSTISIVWNNIGNTDISDSDITANTWHFITIQRDSDTVKCSIDNGSFSTSTLDVTGSTINVAKAPRIGHRTNLDTPGIYEMLGDLDELRIYNRALDSSEITQLYNE